MPTYYSSGVSAHLSAADLAASLSTVQDQQQTPRWKQDQDRLNAVIAGGTTLRERGVGECPGGRGTMQFLGDHEDMPFFLALASLHQPRLRDLPTKPPPEQKSLHLIRDFSSFKSSLGSLAASSMSPLTSLGATPSITPDREVSLEQHSPLSRLPSDGDSPKSTQLQASDKEAAPVEFENLPGSMDLNGTEYLHHALTLTVELPPKAFLACSHGRTGKDLKVEVMFNGDLADVTYVAARSGLGGPDKRSVVQRYSGARIHRQTEKPWVLVDCGASQGITVPETGGSNDVQDRWNDIGSVLVEEAGRRGRNAYGDLTPAGEYLNSLAKLKLPESVAAQLQAVGKNFGVIDIVITAGQGRKYGPEDRYIMRPTRMQDIRYTAVYPTSSPAGSATAIVTAADIDVEMVDATITTHDDMREVSNGKEDIIPAFEVRQPKTGGPPLRPLVPYSSSPEALLEFKSQPSLGFSAIDSTPTMSGERNGAGKASDDPQRMTISSVPEVSTPKTKDTRGSKARLKLLPPRPPSLLDSAQSTALDNTSDRLRAELAKQDATLAVSPSVPYAKSTRRPVSVREVRGLLSRSPRRRTSQRKLVHDNLSQETESAQAPSGTISVKEGKSQDRSVPHFKRQKTGNNDMEMPYVSNENEEMLDTGLDGAIKSKPSQSLLPLTTPAPFPFDRATTPPNKLDLTEYTSASVEAIVLAQKRTDLAVQEGVNPEGRLLQRIASSSPVKPHIPPADAAPSISSSSSPLRNNTRMTIHTTKASALANSPLHLPVKYNKGAQRDRTPLKPIPVELMPNNAAHAVSAGIDIHASTAPAETPQKQETRLLKDLSNRERRELKAAEPTVEDSVRAFTIPELCKDAVVTYAAGEMVSRQTPRARNGEFREESVLVGMRFVVI